MADSAAKPKTKRSTIANKTSKPVTKTTPKTKATSRPATKGASSAAAEPAIGQSATKLIDERIRSLGDWRGPTLTRMRSLILEADPEMVEEWKWMGTPVWSHAGNICTGETYKQVVKLTFAKGASLADPAELFNSSLAGNTRRAIDIRAGETIDAAAFKALILAAVAANEGAKTGKSKASGPKKRTAIVKSALRAKTATKTKPALKRNR